MTKVWLSWRFWAFVCFVAVMLTLTVRLISEITTGHNADVEYLLGRISAIDERMLRLETSTHPATTKRYTSDMAAADKTLFLREIARVDARMTDHLRQESAERVAHDKKCTQRWDKVGRMAERLDQLEAAK